MLSKSAFACHQHCQCLVVESLFLSNGFDPYTSHGTELFGRGKKIPEEKKKTKEKPLYKTSEMSILTRL